MKSRDRTSVLLSVIRIQGGSLFTQEDWTHQRDSTVDYLGNLGLFIIAPCWADGNFGQKLATPVYKNL